MTEAQQPTLVQVGVQAFVQPGPDGTQWVSLQINTPVCSYIVAFPPDQADALAKHLPKGLKDATSEARRKNSGLIVANGQGT